MTVPWTAEHSVAIEEAKRLIESQFPSLAPVNLQRMGEGWDNLAFLANGKWIFRFPRRAVAVPLLDREARLLPALAPHLPLPVPVPHWLGRPQDTFPWPFTGYQRLIGQTACQMALSDEQRRQMAEPLAAFLRTLHGWPLEAARQLGVGGDDIGRLDLPHRLNKALGTLKSLGHLVDQALVNTLLHSHADPRPQPQLPLCLAHGDLYVRHLVVHDGQLAGVIDWGDAHLNHPAIDLMIAYQFFPPTARHLFFRHYGPIDDDTHRLARFRAICHTLNLVHYAGTIGDQPLLDEAKQALTWLSDFAYA